jgi:hypothetical protein
MALVAGAVNQWFFATVYKISNSKWGLIIGSKSGVCSIEVITSKVLHVERVYDEL